MTDSAEGTVKDARELIAALNAGADSGEPQEHQPASLASLREESRRTSRPRARSCRAPSRARTPGSGRRTCASRATRSRRSTKRRRRCRRSQAMPSGWSPICARSPPRSESWRRRRASSSAKSASCPAEIKGDTLPQVGAFAESADRSARKHRQSRRRPVAKPGQRALGKKAGRPGPGEPGFQ